MEQISQTVRDPAWWFTAVVVAIVASVVGGFTKDYRLGWFLTWSKARRQGASSASTQNSGLDPAFGATPLNQLPVPRTYPYRVRPKIVRIHLLQIARTSHRARTSFQVSGRE